MKAPCEIVASKIIPALRAEVARILIENHNMKQTEVSLLLGVTQGAVNHYLSGNRGGEKIDNYVELKKYAQQIANSIKDGEKITYNGFCKYCKSIREML